MAAATDFATEFEQALRKQTRFGTAAFVVAGVATGFVLFWSLQSSGELPAWPWVLGIGIVESVIFGFLIVHLRNHQGKVRTLPRAMGHRLSSAAVARLPTLIFDNGLVFTWDRGAVFHLFGRVGGGRAIPSPEEVRHFLRAVLRMRRILHMSQKRGPELLRTRLEGVREAMLSRFSWLSVYVLRPSALLDPRRPEWIATATLGGPMFKLDADRVLRQVDSIASLLEDAVATARTADSQAVAPS